MTTAQEDKIINQAWQILERREDEAAKMFAVEHEIKISVQRLAMYSSYYQGARVMGEKLMEALTRNPRMKGDDWVYLEAEYRLFVSSLRNTQLFLDGTKIAYRHHKRDKKGKLISCEAYFVEERTVLREIK